MKTRLFSLATLLLLLTFGSANAQYFCFYVDNQSGVSFNELKIRPAGGGAFSRDLLPANAIESGKHFWIKTGNDSKQEWDIQITRMDGTPLLFSWEDISGNWHESQSFITVNAQNLHTLVIGSSGGNLTFGVYDHDEFGYGHPCEN